MAGWDQGAVPLSTNAALIANECTAHGNALFFTQARVVSMFTIKQRGQAGTSVVKPACSSLTGLKFEVKVVMCMHGADKFGSVKYANVSDLFNGDHAVHYSVDQPGSYELHVKLQSFHIQGSLFKLTAILGTPEEPAFRDAVTHQPRTATQTPPTATHSDSARPPQPLNPLIAPKPASALAALQQDVVEVVQR